MYSLKFLPQMRDKDQQTVPVQGRWLTQRSVDAKSVKHSRLPVLKKGRPTLEPYELPRHSLQDQREAEVSLLSIRCRKKWLLEWPFSNTSRDVNRTMQCVRRKPRTWQGMGG
jgi:hypothetical protein